MKPRRFVVLIAFLSLAPFFYLLDYLPDTENLDEELAQLGMVIVRDPVPLDTSGFIDHLGEKFSKQSLEGKWTFAYFGFTRCPDFCPATMSVLGRAEVLINANLDGEGALEYQGVLFTLDPDRDQPAYLGSYVTTFSQNFKGVWSNTDLERLTREMDVVFEKVSMEGGGYLFDHTSNVVVISPDAEYFGYIKRPHTPENIKNIYELLQTKLAS
jgi:protein SCO1/2